MKKQLFTALLCCLLIAPSMGHAQSTEGTDFWVTLMRGDAGAYDELSLTFAAKEATKVYIENSFNGYLDSVEVGNDTIAKLTLNNHASSCYVSESDAEKVSNRALHVTSEKNISLIAANYKNKSFDVAAILPTTALMSEYRIQCYTPADHESKYQGSHFAIVAAENNVVVDITPSAATNGGKQAGVTFATDTLQKGQVYYVWTGKKQGSSADLTGTVIKARENKKIAVFNGNSHTNIPDVRDRDHLYSQAMPVNYWGKRFAITSSLTTIDQKTGYWERIDKIRVQALVDGTIVRIDGDSVYTFDFSKNPRHFYEFDFGAKDEMTDYAGDANPYFEGTSHYIETSCPSAVHLFMTSNRYDHKSGKYCNGDPSEIWVNPVEQKIKKLTFGTFETAQVKDHFINIITTKDNVKSVLLDGDSIYSRFAELKGNADYVFARITNVKNSAHTLTSDSGFIAHVYGFGEKESYGYPAGGNTKDLTAFITINGIKYTADSDNKICGDDKVVFGCELNYEYDSIYWFFDDGKDSLSRGKVDEIEHFYDNSGAYNAYVLIYRHMGDDDGCVNFNATDSIPFLVNIGNYKVDLVDTELPHCAKEGDNINLTIYLNNPSGVSLSGDSVKITFNAASKAAGFTESSIKNQGDTILIIPVPGGAKNNGQYGFHLHIGSECPNSTLDKDLDFTIKYDIPLLVQRYNNVLGLMQDSFPETKQLSDIVWYHNDEIIPNQNTTILYLDEKNPDNSGEYKVCYKVTENGKTDSLCTCPIKFTANTDVHLFEADSLTITASYGYSGDLVFVNADYKGETNIECYAQWIDASGRIYENLKFDIPDGGCTIPTPKQNGLYLLRVVTDKKTRSFKFIINK